MTSFCCVVYIVKFVHGVYHKGRKKVVWEPEYVIFAFPLATAYNQWQKIAKNLENNNEKQKNFMMVLKCTVNEVIS
jgi:hypothetical protein